ncbi:MAG: hypothetical protein AAF802_04355 [Planctomycetota bacterium]
MKDAIRRAMLDSDRFVIEMSYVDAKGQRTRRVVSPIRFVGSDRLLALCLCREEPRQFYLSRCKDVELVPSSDVIMPMPMRPTPTPCPEFAESAPAFGSGTVACVV